MAARKGNAEDELFFQRPNDGADSPTIEPLRINKPQSTSPPRAGSAASSRYNYPPPQSATKQHSFPLPPGASSSAAPLPYPDDEGTFQYTRPAEQRVYRAPYPDDDRGSQSSPLQYSSSPPLRTSSNDTTPRLGTSPVDKRGPRLAERRGTAPKPLPESSSPNIADSQGLFWREPQRPANMTVGPEQSYAHQNVHDGLIAPQPTKLDRFASTASTSTTRASRGSPAPPETPIVGPGESGGGIEARYAAAGISGTATLSSLQAQNAAAAQRMNQYAPPPVPQMPMSPAFSPAPQQHAAPRPWTPTELPADQPHGPPTVYQGANQVSSPQRPEHARQGSSGRVSKPPNAMEQDFQRMHLSASPPPAYSSVSENGPTNGATTAQGYPNEKSTAATAAAAAASSSSKADYAQPLASPGLQHPGHPAFANDPRPDQGGPVQQFAGPQPFTGTLGPASPPPLPEGWIAHLDQNSGQYYYIHLATQATQWEFPKGPTPLNHDAATPLSPTVSTYGNPLLSPGLMSPGLSHFGKQPMASPGLFPPNTPGYAESIMSSMSQATTTGGFSGPPPSSGVDMYKIAPTNGVYFGPYLKYINMDIERGIWLGSIMLVTDGPQPPTIHIHQSVDLSPNPRQLKANPIFTHQRWVFYRYDIDLQMGEGPGDKWTYAITSHLGCTRYEFVVAGRYETNWRFIAHSGNDFAMNTNANERSRLGGIGFMWKDILQKNIECGGFHVQLGLGDQIYGDRLWKEVPLLKQWLALPGKEARKATAWTAKHEEDVSHSYFHYYTSHFDQPYLREAFAQIPHVLEIDDHDM